MWLKIKICLLTLCEMLLKICIGSFIPNQEDGSWLAIHQAVCTAGSVKSQWFTRLKSEIWAYSILIQKRCVPLSKGWQRTESCFSFSEVIISGSSPRTYWHGVSTVRELKVWLKDWCGRNGLQLMWNWHSTGQRGQNEFHVNKAGTCPGGANTGR